MILINCVRQLPWRNSWLNLIYWVLTSAKSNSQNARFNTNTSNAWSLVWESWQRTHLPHRGAVQEIRYLYQISWTQGGVASTLWKKNAKIKSSCFVELNNTRQDERRHRYCDKLLFMRAAGYGAGNIQIKWLFKQATDNTGFFGRKFNSWGQLNSLFSLVWWGLC